MSRFEARQPILKLPKNKGGYYYLHIDKTWVEHFERGRNTRLICELAGRISIPCGLNHLGDGNFFVILASRHITALDKQEGDRLDFVIYEDPNPLGVAVPEVLQAYLDQEEGAARIYESLTDGRKRTLIHSVNKVKNIDLQLEKIREFLEEERIKARGRGKHKKS